MIILASNTKAVAILHTFNRKEIGRFRKFLQAEYFNNNALLLTTFNCLHKKKERIKAEKFTRQHLHQYLSAKHQNDKIDVTNLLSKLREQLENFLIQTELNNDPCRQKQLLLKSLAARKLSAQFAKQVELTSNILQKDDFRDGGHFWNTFELQHQQFNHPEFDGTGEEGEKIIESVVENLNNGYLFFRLKIECERLSRGKIYSTAPLPQVTNALLTYLQQPEVKLLPTVYIYQQLLELFTQPLDQGKFGDVVKEFEEHINLYEPVEALAVLQLLVNYSYWQYGRKQVQFRPIIFDLYEMGVTYDLWINSDGISDTSFTNVVMVAIANERYDWAVQFIEDYENLIVGQHQQDAAQFALANVYYRKQDFVKAIDCLNSVDFNSFSYKIRVRAAAIRWRYEDLKRKKPQLDTNVLNDKIENFRRWLHNQNKSNLPKDKKMLYLNFVHAVSQMEKYAPEARYDDTVYKNLATKVNSYQPLLTPEWFTAQLNQIKKKGGDSH